MEQHERIRQLQELETLASWMDDRFRIPGTSIRFGLDPIIGLIPGVGDTATVATAAYMIAKARSLGVPTSMQIRMAVNVFIDWLIGLIPLLGDIFDVGFKAHRRNAQLIREYVASQQPRDAEYVASDTARQI